MAEQVASVHRDGEVVRAEGVGSLNVALDVGVGAEVFKEHARNEQLLAAMDDRAVADDVLTVVAAMQLVRVDGDIVRQSLSLALSVPVTDDVWGRPELAGKWQRVSERLLPAVDEQRLAHEVPSVGDLSWWLDEDALSSAERLAHQARGLDLLERRVALCSSAVSLAASVGEGLSLRRARQVQNRGVAWLRSCERAAEGELERVGVWWQNQMTKWGDWEPPSSEEDEFVF